MNHDDHIRIAAAFKRATVIACEAVSDQQSLERVVASWAIGVAARTLAEDFKAENRFFDKARFLDLCGIPHL